MTEPEAESVAMGKPVRALLTPEAVRSRCEEIFGLAVAGELRHFAMDLDRLDDAAARVLDEIHSNYPEGSVPLHSRWRHFELQGRDFWGDMQSSHPGLTRLDSAGLARARFDLAIISVLLDAGAGERWTYTDGESGLCLSRSEGLALASLRLFQSGILSAGGADDPLRVDADGLTALTAETLAAALQVTDDNPLVGLAERADLLNRLGKVLKDRPGVFERNGESRPGHLFDRFKGEAEANNNVLAARDVLIALLVNLGAMWPSGHWIGNTCVGDVGHHPRLQRGDETDELIPFHKLSQWMAYSLIEPLIEAGVAVKDLDGLTGLAEYRNGGLFMDTGVLKLKDDQAAGHAHAPDSELVVEWRALTVGLLDRVAVLVRDRMGADGEGMSLGAILQGGTWTAGRKLAREKRPGAAPPITILSNGTVF